MCGQNTNLYGRSFRISPECYAGTNSQPRRHNFRIAVTRSQSGASANVKLVHRRSMDDTCVVDFSSLLLIPVRQTHRAESSAICKQ